MYTKHSEVEALAYQTDCFMNGINFSTGINTSIAGRWSVSMMCDSNVLIMKGGYKGDTKWASIMNKRTAKAGQNGALVG